MEPVLIEVYRQMLARHHCTVDQILCNPTFRNEFVMESRRNAGSEVAEYDLLKGLSNLRKKSKLPRSRDD